MKATLEKDIVIKSPEKVEQGANIIFGAVEPKDLSRWFEMKGIKKTEYKEGDINTYGIDLVDIAQEMSGEDFVINNGKIDEPEIYR